MILANLMSSTRFLSYLLAWSFFPIVIPLHGDTPIPFTEVFSGAEMSTNWIKTESLGTRLELRTDGLHFNGPAYGLAHAKRALGLDQLTVSARIAQWGSIYLVWDDQTWCAAGQISPTPFGRLYSTSVKRGVADKDDHRGIDFGLPRWVRIQLGEKFVRFSWSDDGQQWTDLRVIPRAKAFSGPPKWLAVGKYYEASNLPFAASDSLKPVSQAEGDKIGGRILEVKIEETSPEKAKLSTAELKKLTAPRIDPVTARFRKTTAEPTYEAIVGLYPPMKYPREVVGVPVHPMDIGIDRLGRFDVSPWSRAPVAWFEVGNPGKPFGTEGVSIKRALLNGYLPVDTLETSHDGTQSELTAFGWSENFSVTAPIYAYARLKVRPKDGAPLPREVALTAPGNKRVSFHATNTIGDATGVYLRFKFPEPATATEITATEFENKQNEVAAFWEKTLAPAMRFEVPEARVMEAYKAWIVYSMLNADTVNGFIEPHDGTGFYDEMFGNSVSVHSMAMDAYGLHGYAARILEMQCHFQQSNGLYTQVCGLTDPGGFLCGLCGTIA